MESNEEPKRNNQMPNNPKPKDDIQQHIETVVPHTEQPEVASPDAVSAPEEKPDTKRQEVGETNGETSDPHDNNTKGQDSDDARDQVETVST